MTFSQICARIAIGLLVGLLIGAWLRAGIIVTIDGRPHLIQIGTWR